MPNYPVPTAKRMPWDKDGTVLIAYHESTVQNEASDPQKAVNNSEKSTFSYTDAADTGCFHSFRASAPGHTIANGSTLIYAFVFPNKRDVAYCKFALAGYSTNPTATPVLEYSTDTTNGVDGAWSAFGSNGVFYNNQNITDPKSTGTIPTYRVIESNPASGVKGVRLRIPITSSNVACPGLAIAHLYGDTTSGENPDRLEVWEPGSNAEIAAGAFDWGDIPRNSTAQKTFRIKNRSATLTANSIVVSLEQNTAMSPSQAGWHTFSTDGTNWSSTINIGNLAPGAISGTLYVRRVTPSNAQLSLGALRIAAHPASWS